MRIPSTKRICFVGQKGSFTPRLESFIEEKRNKANKGFVPRDISEELRLKNCQNLDKSKRDEFIARIVKKLESSNSSEEESVSISSLVDNFSAEEKALLKSECGGFQTLIKNNRQLFHVQVRPRNSDFMHTFFSYHQYTSYLIRSIRVSRTRPSLSSRRRFQLWPLGAVQFCLFVRNHCNFQIH